MKYILVLLALGILCQNIRARSLDNAGPNDFNRRLAEFRSKKLEKFQQIGTKHYLIENTETLFWPDAVGQCKDLNAGLVSLQNEEEWLALKEVLVPGHSYWVDVNDIVNEGTFVSITSGDIKAPFLKWDDGEPSALPGQDNCVELRADHDYKMNDVHCFESNYYICEAKNISK